MVINLQPAGLHFEEKITVFEKRILTPRKQEMSDRGDVLALDRLRAQQPPVCAAGECWCPRE